MINKLVSVTIYYRFATKHLSVVGNEAQSIVYRRRDFRIALCSLRDSLHLALVRFASLGHHIPCYYVNLLIPYILIPFNW